MTTARQSNCSTIDQHERRVNENQLYERTKHTCTDLIHSTRCDLTPQLPQAFEDQYIKRMDRNSASTRPAVGWHGAVQPRPAATNRHRCPNALSTRRSHVVRTRPFARRAVACSGGGGAEGEDAYRPLDYQRIAGRRSGGGVIVYRARIVRLRLDDAVLSITYRACASAAAANRCRIGEGETTHRTAKGWRRSMCVIE